jgi:hypothetical protein
MKINYLAALTSIVLTTGLLQPITQAQEITQSTISTPTSVESQASNGSRSEIEYARNTNIFFLSRERSILVSRKEDPLPPRPSPPEGSR